MELLPLSLCLLTLSGSTSAAGNDSVTIRVKEGRDVTLPCNIKKDISSEAFDWKKDGQKEVFLYEGSVLSGQDPQFKGRVSHSDAELMNGDASITIRETKVADSGVYTCEFPNLHQTFSVKLVVDPVIIRVEEGRNATLPCYSNKNIRSERFEWKKDGQKDVYWHEGSVYTDVDPQFTGRVSHSDAELRNGDASITIRETKVADSGVYTCEFTNLNQTFSVYLVVGKTAKVFIKKTETKDGTLLECLVSDASPGFKLNISWFDTSGTKLTETQIDTESGRNYILTTTVTKTDTYRCVATMEELSHQDYEEIDVSVSGPETIRVKEGRNATLPCKINKDISSEETSELSGQDPQFICRVSHSDAELRNGDASITIRETKVADSGVYTCNFPHLHQTFTVKLVVGSSVVVGLAVALGVAVLLLAVAVAVLFLYCRKKRSPETIRGEEGGDATSRSNVLSERFDWKEDGQKTSSNIYESLHAKGQLSSTCTSGQQEDGQRDNTYE